MTGVELISKSFHDKLRDECLNREIFRSLAEARIILEGWRVDYNEQRPHSALGYLTSVDWEAASPAPVDIVRTAF
jgi:putative transposase